MRTRIIICGIVLALLGFILFVPIGSTNLIQKISTIFGQTNIFMSFEGSVWVTVFFVILILVLALAYAAYWKKNN